MDLILDICAGKKSVVAKRLMSRSYVDHVDPIKNEHKIVVALVSQRTSTQSDDDIVDEIRRMRHVVRVSKPNLPRPSTLHGIVLFKHCFFDVDSTLTKGAPGYIAREVRTIFKNMKEQGIRVYFSTGRSMNDVNTLMSQYEVQDCAIAENGGLLIGFGKDGYTLMGSSDEPKKMFALLKQDGAKEDVAQMGRITEVVVDKSSISRKLVEAVKEKNHIKVSILESKNSIHITAEGINKGSTMRELCNKLRLNLDYEEVISVGDSELDIPMFEESDRSYLLGNATVLARRNAPESTVRLTGTYVDGIRQVYHAIGDVL